MRWGVFRNHHLGKHMISKALIGAAALMLAATTASAGVNHPIGKNGILPGNDGRTTVATTPQKGAVVPNFRVFEPGETALYDNLAEKYPDGTYFCCYGWTVSGPNSLVGEQVWVAASFTPSSDATVNKIELGIGIAAGTNALDVSLAADSGGLPGNTLAKFGTISNLPPFGSCCQTMAAKNKTGVAVTAGTTYWVVVKTGKNGTDTWAAWNMNVTEQITPVNGAANFGSGWQAGGYLPGMAFAVLGH